ncbi:MAG: hypothetical protein KDJ35_05525 [Alphaproteobacteria bacterium]|nr:hypothetical protein [Alphaproteobacteria bacterium]
MKKEENLKACYNFLSTFAENLDSVMHDQLFSEKNIDPKVTGNARAFFHLYAFAKQLLDNGNSSTADIDVAINNLTTSADFLREKLRLEY